MAYENFMSKTDDVVWLAYQLKNKLGGKISINKMGLYKEVLEGRYNLKGHDRGIDFGILYSDKEFLRVSVGEICTYTSSYEDKLSVLNELKNAISTIVRDGLPLGEPSVFYNVREDKYMIPHIEYIYADKEETIKAFQDKTIFDDGGIPEDVIILDSVKESEEFLLITGYSYGRPNVQSGYCGIRICARLKNKSDIETKKLRRILNDNLDDLFNDRYDNPFINYMCYNNDIAYVVACIKKNLYLAEEVKLSITIIGNGNDRCRVNYINGNLVKYESSSKLFEYNLNTCYDIKNGIMFNTNCILDTSDIVENGISTEIKRINELRDVVNKYNIKSNDNLLKLVRKMGNK